jgi:outer membrane protein assembly factor BamB
MARGRGDMREVELVEQHDDVDGAAHTTDARHAAEAAHAPRTPDPADDRLSRDERPAHDPITPAAAPRWPTSTSTSARTRTRTRNVTLTVLAALLVVATVSALVSQRRDAARLEALAEVPGVVAPIGGPVRELWQLDGWPLAPLSEVDGRIVTVLSVAPGGSAAVALDPVTGDAVWRTPLPADSADGGPTECVVTGAAPERGTDAAPDGPRLVVCVIADAMALATDEHSLERVTYPVRARLVVVDALTGDVRADDPVDPTVSVAVIGADLILGTVDTHGHAHVEARDPATGQTHWTFRGATPVAPDPFGLRRVFVHTEGDLVVADAGTVWVLTADGELARELPGSVEPFRGYTQVLADGRFVVRSPYEAGTTALVHVGTGRTRAVAGTVATPRPDDRSLPDLLLVVPDDRTGLVAQDLSTGATLWTLEGRDVSPAMILDRRVLAVEGDVLEALDGASGSVVWSTPVPRLSPSSSLVTDGRVVLVSTGAGADGAVVALDLSDGRQAWSTPVDDHPYSLFAEEGRLFGFGTSGLRAYGSPAGPS